MGILNRIDFVEWGYNHRTFLIVIGFIIFFLILFFSYIVLKKSPQETGNYAMAFAIPWCIFLPLYGIYIRTSMYRRTKGNRNSEVVFIPPAKQRFYYDEETQKFWPENEGPNKNRYHNNTPHHKSPNWIDLRDRAFEIWLLELYQNRGYRVEHNGGPADHGADLILFKEGRKIVVQAKGYGGKVNGHAVDQANSGRGFYHADEAWAVTNNFFTAHAKIHAKGLRVKLYDQNSLRRYLETERQYHGHRR